MERVIAGSAPSPQILADAFSEFISASAQLESSYRSLQQEIARLNDELAQRNAALTRSLAENDRIRVALQQMLDSMPCGVLVVDGAGRVAMINPECRRLLGLGETPVLCVRDVALSGQIDFEELVSECDDQSEREVRTKSDCGERWLAIRNRSLFTAPGGAKDRLQRIWILRDVTAEKQAANEREAARRTAVLAEISTILAHEIRNPLASMELFAELMEQDPANAAQWISNLRAGIRSLSGTVNNVLNLNSPNAPVLGPVNLSSCVQAGVDFVRPIADQGGISLVFLSANNALHINGNEQAIQQIVLNIVSNAIRHTATGGEVRISIRDVARKSGKAALITIADTGCGIPAEVIERIFEPGFSGSGDSPGLGLTVCKRLIEQLGGKICVSSRPSKGTSFQLEFPVL